MTLPVQPIVHVAGADGHCRPALVLDAGPNLIRVRVFVPRALGDPGTLDYEGDCAHSSDPRIYPNPDDLGGGFRVADAWHEIGDCGHSLDRLQAALAGVVGS